MKSKLSTLLLSLLLCATCLAQPDSRPGPYQATLAKINALLVGGAATVKEIEFTVDGSALASSSKTQAYSDGNAGSLFVRVPTAKQIQGLVNNNILLNLGRGSNVVGDTNWAIGKYAAGASGDNTATGINGSGATMGYNVATGGLHSFSLAGVIGATITDVAQKFYSSGVQTVQFDSGGITLLKNLYYSAAGSATSSLTSQWADASAGNLFANVPTGKYEQHRVAGQSILKLGNNGNGTAANYWEIGDSTGPSSYVQGSGANMVHYAASIYYESTTHRFCNTSAVESARITSASGFLEAGKISLGGTIGSSADPGAGSLGLTGNIQFTGAGTASSSLTTIWADATAGNLSWNVPAGKFTQGKVAGGALLVLGKAYGSQGDEFWGIGAHPGSNAGTKSGVGSNGAGVLVNAGTGGLVDICSGNAFILRCATAGITITDGVNLGSSGTTTGNKIGTASNQKWSFWGASPTVQPALTGTSTTLTTAGSTNALYADSTSTGGIGSTAYSLPDVVRNLKTAGLLAP